MLDLLNAFIVAFYQVFGLQTFSLMLVGIGVGFIVGIVPGPGGPTPAQRSARAGTACSARQSLGEGSDDAGAVTRNRSPSRFFISDEFVS
jgi:hypothetical protein